MAEEPASLGRRVVRGVDPLLHIPAGLGQDLAHLPRHRVGDGFLSLDQQVADPAEHVASRRSGSPGPQGKPALGGADRGVHVLAIRIGEPPDQVGRVRGIAVIEVGIGAGGYPLTGDEVLEGLGHVSKSDVRSHRNSFVADH